MNTEAGKRLIKEDGYVHLRHNKTLLLVHVIFVTKYRKELEAKGIWEAIKQHIYDACSDNYIHIVTMESDKDHIHMLLRYEPTQSVSGIVSKLKQISTYRIWKQYPKYLKTLYWKEHTLWSDGYFAASVGNASKETIENYIKNQG